MPDRDSSPDAKPEEDSWSDDAPKSERPPPVKSERPPPAKSERPPPPKSRPPFPERINTIDIM
ncbi:MAG: hypothetical protein ACRELY_22170, partial [Polyangiaceae bacterium]